MSKIKLAVVFLVAVFVTIVIAGVPLQRYEALMKQQSQDLGLYNSSDKVLTLSDANFNETVLLRNQSNLVEFYNSYCGHCKRFAPSYKLLAEQLHDWRDVLGVCAIDCAAEENNDICREYEVMSYPTLRYFPPGYSPRAESYGTPLHTQELNEIRVFLAQQVAAENRTANMTDWPNFTPLTLSEAQTLLEGHKTQPEITVLVYEPAESTIGVETILHFHRWRPNVQVRRINSKELAAKFQIDVSHYRIATVNRNGVVVPYAPTEDSSRAYVLTIKGVLQTENITERTVPLAHQSIADSAVTDANEAAKLTQMLAEVKRNKHFVYQADLEMAIRGALFNEIPKAANISEERLLALQRFLATLQRYNPLGPQGRLFVSKLYDFVMQFNQGFSGKEFEDEVDRLRSLHPDIFSSSRYIGCAGSQAGTRGFTCSLWQLFHFMTVQAARTDFSQDPLEVLQTMHGYVKYYFGCTECSQHFQQMASRRKIWDTPSKEEAVLWLWAAHNEVNERLAGDATEDPQFPKIQFPSSSSCTQCYRNNNKHANGSSQQDISWDKNAVLSFLKNIHNPEYISRYGVDNEAALQPSSEKLRSKRMISNVFTDVDMRMGMLLYGFCIVMMIVAFKLFAFKGYRKKPYSHDLLGKV